MLGELNPALRVPTLVLDDGRSLAESNAILWHFADGTTYLPDDRYESAQVLQWLFFEQYSHEPYIAVVRFWVSVATDARRRPRSRRARKGGYAALDALERHCADRLSRRGAYTIAESRSTPTRTSPTRWASTSAVARDSPMARPSRVSRDTF